MQPSFLNTLTVDDLLPQGGMNIVEIDSDATVPQAFQVLSKFNISSAPVVRRSTGEYLGFIDMLDIVTFIVKIFKETELLGEDFYALLEQEARFTLEFAGAIADLSRRNPFCPVQKGSSLAKALELLGKNHVHRIAIVDKQRVVAILTQSAAIAWLSKHEDKLGEIGHRSLKTLRIGFKPVVSIPATARAIDAFTLMHQQGVSAVALLERDGTLLSNISAKDIKEVANDVLFTKLYRTALEFASAVRSHEINVSSPSIVSHPDDTLLKVIAKLAATRIHRVYITDEERKPVGVLSLGDVLLIVTQTELAQAAK